MRKQTANRLILTIVGIAASTLVACSTTNTSGNPQPVLPSTTVPTTPTAPTTQQPTIIPTVDRIPTHTPTTTRAPAPTTKRTKTSTVHPGAYCSPRGATGSTTAGTRMVCGTAKDGKLRWIRA